MNRTLKILIIVSIFFGIYYFFDDLFFKNLRTYLNQKIEFIGISHILTYFIIGIPIYIGTVLIDKPKNFFFNLGIDKSIIRGLILSFFFTLPMFIGFAFFFNLNKEINIDKILIGVISASFFEELFFRGFLFGQIFRKSRIGFIPAIIIGAVLFALGHLYQSQELEELIGIFLMTFLGAILFAWVFCEWKFNLWIPIFLHLFMNLSWVVFTVSENALGGMYANLFRILTVILVVLFTIIYKKKKGIKLEINKGTIWIKKNNWLQHSV